MLYGSRPTSVAFLGTQEDVIGIGRKIFVPLFILLVTLFSDLETVWTK